MEPTKIDWQAAWRAQVETIGRLQIKIERLQNELAYKDLTVDKLNDTIRDLIHKVEQLLARAAQ